MWGPVYCWRESAHGVLVDLFHEPPEPDAVPNGMHLHASALTLVDELCRVLGEERPVWIGLEALRRLGCELTDSAADRDRLLALRRHLGSIADLLFPERRDADLPY